MKQFNFKKKYGQNFLQNDNVIENIVTSINPKESDLIIEIGPGGGAITKRLRRYNANFIAYEIDTDTKKFLSKLENQKTKIIYEDFLETDVKKELEKYTYNNLFIIGNLPYYITTPIIEKIIDLDLKEKSVTIMVQKEVADRFLSKPCNKEYGSITVLLNYYYDIEKICDAPREYFVPSPNVDSTVIKLTKNIKGTLNCDNLKILLRDSFQFKRKTLNNNLKKYDKDILEKVLSKYNLSLSNRAEELPLEVFIELTNTLF